MEKEQYQTDLLSLNDIPENGRDHFYCRERWEKLRVSKGLILRLWFTCE